MHSMYSTAPANWAELQIIILNTDNLQLYGIKYSYPVLKISEQIYLTHR